MPKLLGFLRSRRKGDEADWAIAQVRTAARLGDLFTADVSPSVNDTAPGGGEDDNGAAVADSSVEVDPGPWPGGPRPPIIVVGMSDVVSVLAGGGETRPTGVTRVAGAVSVAEEVSQRKLIGVMARARPTVGGDSRHPPNAAARDPRVALPVAAHLFPPVRRPEKPADPSSAGSPSAGRPAAGGTAAVASPARPATRAKTRAAPVPPAYCPYCARLLEPAPKTSRRCERCHQRIVVKRIDGRVVYLTEAAVLVFEAERRRVLESARWTRDRDRWLRLASAVGAPVERQAQLTAALASEAVVAAARTLYLTTVDRAIRRAQRDRDWDEASRLSRDKAALLYRVAGSPVPPPADVVAMFRESVVAELRGIAEISRNAELVSARCCAACRGDDRIVVRIAQELRAPRLPHTGCPKGLCLCHWDLAARDRMTISRYLERRPGPEARVAQAPGDRTAGS